MHEVNAMKTFDGEHQLQFTQPKAGKSRYELRSESGDLIGTMEKPSVWKSLALVDAPGARLELDRAWSWRGGYRIPVRSAGTGDEIALFKPNTWTAGGTLTFANGRIYHWKSNTWGSKWTWIDEQDEPVLGFAVGGFMKPNADVHFDTAEPETLVLLFLGWYLYTLYLSDSATAVIAAT